jgi:hypothetical protein
MSSKICSKCKKDLDLSMFSMKIVKTGRRQSRCKSCVSETAKERGWSLYSRHQKDERANRILLGKCRVCKEPVLPNRRICRKHYVVDVANKTIGVATSAVADQLLARLDNNPYCPYTKEALVLGVNAHLDHILSLKNRPDLKGDLENIEWVSETANLAKNGFNKDEFINFCKIVATCSE